MGGIIIKNKYIVFFVILLSLISILYCSIKPSITPNDIEIRAVLEKIYNQNINEISIMQDTNCDYLLTINLNKKTDQPLTKNIEYTIYPYISGNSNPYSLIEDISNFRDISKDLSIGIDGLTATKALEKLNELDIVESSDYNFFSKKQIWGFTYRKEDYPITIRSYFKEDYIIDKNKNVILYSYYEKKFGKNLSWVKAVKVDIE